jgi:hypothetical protein
LEIQNAKMWADEMLLREMLKQGAQLIGNALYTIE